jgi:flagellar protein FliO/FliZ
MKTDPDLFMMIFKSAGMLFLVLGFMIAVLYLMKKFSTNKFGIQSQGVIKTLATHYITPKEKIILIEVMGERLLLGSTPQSMNFLSKLKSTEEFQFPEDKKPEFFKKFLKKALNKETETKEY